MGFSRSNLIFVCAKQAVRHISREFSSIIQWGRCRWFCLISHFVMSLNCVTISLIYAVPSLTLYAVTVVIIILHWKNVKSSFYQFYIFEFIINTITFVNAMFSVKMPTATCAECTLHKYFQEQSVPSFMSQFQFVIQFNMAFVQYGLTTTVAINRMSIVLYPKFFEQVKLPF